VQTRTKVTIGLAAVVAIAIAVVLVLANRDAGKSPVAAVDDSTGSTGQDTALIREDSRIVGTEGSSDVTFVEFLDFECEACGAFYPLVEQLRQQYEGEVTFIARYFPLPSHFNSMRAARAVEAAARQDKFVEMYQLMYENQKSWAEKKVPQDDVFRAYAKEIGLDMAQFDADYADPAVEQRVQKDVDDGTELGVQGTPTFYIDGKLFEPKTVQDFYDTLDKALGK